ncbi:MAG: hypothetical protein NZZ41_03895 [Candidatus Dojkabacteria bacterium]|nr:hypothetical protein [Candidatus Dojkabacteria bacterium]
MKYKNISPFKQSIIFHGKRIILEPNQVIESDHEMKYIFLEKVDDNTPISQPKDFLQNTFFDLKYKLDSIQENVVNNKEIKNKIEEIEKKLEFIFTKISQIEEILNKEVKYGINRKMEMLKTAVMTLQEDFYNIKFDENGKIVENESASESFR